MPLAKLAIKQPIFVTMVLLAITLVGVMSYMRMGVDLYPDMSNPIVSVTVSFPGATPQDVENLVTIPVEQAVSVLNGVASTSSTSREGMSMVTVSFVPGFDQQQGAQEVREVLDSVTRRLPSGANPPVLMRFDPNSAPFMTVAMGSTGTPLSAADLNQILSNVIQPRLEQLTGVAAVTMSGIPVQQVIVSLNAQKLDTLKVSPLQVVSALQSENTIMPSGTMTSGNQILSLRTSAQFQNVDEISNIIVARHGTLAIQLSQVATVALQLQQTQSYVRVNGQNVNMMQIQGQSGSNEVQTAGLIKAELASISHDFPNLTFTVVQDDSTFIDQSNNDVMLTLILGALLAAAIVFVFFRNFRNTLITVIGLPIIVMATFAVISYMGFTRNIITLMALSLSIGLLIDDAIVVRENIFRHMENGESAKVAAEKATGEIAFAVLAISLTLVAMFIPVAFTSGTIGRLFKEFGITVAVAVLISLFEAFTLAPLLSAYFAKSMKHTPKEGAVSPEKGLGGRLSQIWPSIVSGYRNILAWSLHYRWAVICLSLALLGVSAWFLMKMPVSYFPATDSGQISIGVNMPTGSTLDKTDQIAQVVEKTVMTQPEVQRTYSRINAGSGSISVQLKSGVQTDAIIQRLRGLLPQYRTSLIFTKPNQFLGIGMGGGGTQVRGRPIVISIQGPSSLDTLNGVADQVVSRLSIVPGLTDVATSLPPAQPELHVVVDRQRADAAGISPVLVGSTIRSAFQSTTATQVDWQDHRIDVVVQLRSEDLSNATALMNLPIVAPNGTSFPLSAVAQVQQGSGPTVLSRQNQLEQIVVGANLEGRTQGQVMPDVQKAMAGLTLPAGDTWNYSGTQAQTQSAFGSLIFALILGLVFVYMVLASQFGSFIHPFTVMAALPLAAVGSVVAMVLTHTELTIISMIGLILMMGLATKNSILLVDFIIRHRKQGLERTEAVLAAGPLRLRPILMTTFAIIFGMIPTAMGMGASGAFRAPMAIAVIGGVFSSTLLSLVAIPVVYTLVDDVTVFFVRLFSRQPVPSLVSEAATPAVSQRRESEPGLNGITRSIDAEIDPPADD